MLLTEWNAMKQVAQISTHDLAFNDIRKTSCCLQSSHFNKLTDIHNVSVRWLNLERWQDAASHLSVHSTWLRATAESEASSSFIWINSALLS